MRVTQASHEMRTISTEEPSKCAQAEYSVL